MKVNTSFRLFVLSCLMTSSVISPLNAEKPVCLNENNLGNYSPKQPIQAQTVRYEGALTEDFKNLAGSPNIKNFEMKTRPKSSLSPLSQPLSQSQPLSLSQSLSLSQELFQELSQELSLSQLLSLPRPQSLSHFRSQLQSLSPFRSQLQSLSQSQLLSLFQAQARARASCWDEVMSVTRILDSFQETILSLSNLKTFKFSVSGGCSFFSYVLYIKVGNIICQHEKLESVSLDIEYLTGDSVRPLQLGESNLEEIKLTSVTPSKFESLGEELGKVLNLKRLYLEITHSKDVNQASQKLRLNKLLKLIDLNLQVNNIDGTFSILELPENLTTFRFEAKNEKGISHTQVYLNKECLSIDSKFLPLKDLLDFIKFPQFLAVKKVDIRNIPLERDEDENSLKILVDTMPNIAHLGLLSYHPCFLQHLKRLPLTKLFFKESIPKECMETLTITLDKVNIQDCVKDQLRWS